MKDVVRKRVWEHWNSGEARWTVASDRDRIVDELTEGLENRSDAHVDALLTALDLGGVGAARALVRAWRDEPR